ncbi:DNA repair protein RadA [Clostridioides difficile]|nr:DNA repair protein RadA [Clostridioides difficile]
MVGEVGLTGEIRPISSAERLVKEAEKLGFKNVIIPERNLDKIKTNNIKVIGIRHLMEVINKIF